MFALIGYEKNIRKDSAESPNVYVTLTYIGDTVCLVDWLLFSGKAEIGGDSGGHLLCIHGGMGDGRKDRG